VDDDSRLRQVAEALESQSRYGEPPHAPAARNRSKVRASPNGGGGDRLVRALVFGGSGALARSLNEVLIDRGWSVDLIVRAPPAVTEPVPPTYATTRLSPQSERRTDYCLIGSTSSYAVPRHRGLLRRQARAARPRARNDEYAQTPRRFWLASMEAMDTPMGRLLTDQDPACTRRVAACART
jgi:hypothetical protein